MDELFAPLKWTDQINKFLNGHWIKRIFISRIIESKAHSEISSQLNIRDEKTYELWKEKYNNYLVFIRVKSIIKNEYNWPNDYFIPTDPFAIVFMIPWDDLEIANVIIEIEQAIEIKINDDYISMFVTLGDLVAYITQLAYST